MKHYLTLDLKNNPELIEEYMHWHKPDQIWKEIPAGIRQVGIMEMEIFLFQNRMFMVVQTPDDFDWDKAMLDLSKLPRQQEWETFMAQFQQLYQGQGINGKWQRMDRIFQLSSCL
jgi:L-rhamnose mutarotase